MSQTKSLSLIGVGDIAGNAITSIFWFILATWISPEDFGELFYLIGIASLACSFTLFGNQNTLSVLVSKNIPIHTTLYFISMVLAFIVSIIGIFIFPDYSIIFLIFGYTVNTLSIGYLLGKQKFKTYSIHTLIQKSLTLILGIILFLIFGTDGIIPALTLTYLTFFIIFVKQFKENRIDFSLVRKKIKFILNNYFIEILTKSNSHLNKFFIVPILGLAILGNFSLSLQLVNVGLTLTLIVLKYTIPNDSKGISTTKLKKFTLLFSIIIAFVGSILSPYIISDFFPQYDDVTEIVQIISFSIIPLTLSRLFLSKLISSEQNKKIILSRIVSIVSFITLIIFLTPTFGIMGLSYSYMVSVILECLVLIPNYRKLTF